MWTLDHSSRHGLDAFAGRNQARSAWTAIAGLHLGTTARQGSDFPKRANHRNRAAILADVTLNRFHRGRKAWSRPNAVELRFRFLATHISTGRHARDLWIMRLRLPAWLFCLRLAQWPRWILVRAERALRLSMPLASEP